MAVSDTKEQLEIENEKLKQQLQAKQNECGYLADQLQEEKKLRSRETNALINRVSEARYILTRGLGAVGGDHVQRWLDDAARDERERATLFKDLERYGKRIKDLEKRLGMIVDVAQGKAALLDMREAFAARQCTLYEDVNCVECGERHTVEVADLNPDNLCPSCRERQS